MRRLANPRITRPRSRRSRRLPTFLHRHRAIVDVREEALAFADVTQDGDQDGCLFLARDPTEKEAATIRVRLGIAKKRAMSEDELIRLRAHAVAHQFRRSGRPSTTAALPT
jgi:hypothetical protein